MLKHLAEYPLEQILDLFTTLTGKTTFEVQGKTYKVKLDSERYKLFVRDRDNLKCAICGLEGSFFGLDTHEPPTAHLNLYGRKGDERVLMTKDHIIPKSRGGKDLLHNYQLMCQPCNSFKSNQTIGVDHLQEIVNLQNRVVSLQKEREKILDFIRRYGTDMATLIEQGKHLTEGQ